MAFKDAFSIVLMLFMLFWVNIFYLKAKIDHHPSPFLEGWFWRSVFELKNMAIWVYMLRFNWGRLCFCSGRQETFGNLNPDVFWVYFWVEN